MTDKFSHAGFLTPIHVHVLSTCMTHVYVYVHVFVYIYTYACVYFAGNSI